MAIKIRPHHLFCLLTYEGKGYSADFIENFNTIAERISAGEPILFVEGPDDICAPILNEKRAHCLEKSVYKRDELATIYAQDHLCIDTKPGSFFQYSNNILHKMRKNFLENKKRTLCKFCPWEKMCNNIASKEFHSAKIKVITLEAKLFNVKDQSL